MEQRRRTVVGLGEILWDLLPKGKLMGGAPANFAFHANQLGDYGIPVSRVGDDPLGREILDRLSSLGLSTDHIQMDSTHPTGTVEVEIDANGQPKYTIVESVAWDHLEWTPALAELASQTDAVCYGSLAQRSPRSRETIGHFLRACPSHALKIFDINLRGNFYSAPLLDEGLKLADAAKLNDEELPILIRLLNLNENDDTAASRELIARYDLRMVCLTRGAKGSLIVSPDDASAHAGHPAEVSDTIGSGDAFVAAVAHHALRGASLETMNEAANRLGAYVATQPGGTPTLPDSLRGEILGE